MRSMFTCSVLGGAPRSVAFAHPGLGSPESFAAGDPHPIMAIDYVTAVLAVGLWAVLKGHRPVWARPVSFVAMMFIGGALGMADRAMPYVDPGILASIVVMGLLVAFAIDLPVAAGGACSGVGLSCGVLA